MTLVIAKQRSVENSTICRDKDCIVIPIVRQKHRVDTKNGARRNFEGEGRRGLITLTRSCQSGGYRRRSITPILSKEGQKKVVATRKQRIAIKAVERDNLMGVLKFSPPTFISYDMKCITLDSLDTWLIRCSNIFGAPVMWCQWLNPLCLCLQQTVPDSDPFLAKLWGQHV